MQGPYSYDVIVYDDVGMAFSDNLLKHGALGGSEVALVQLVNALSERGVRVLALNRTSSRESYGGPQSLDDKRGRAVREYDNIRRCKDERLSCKTLIISRYSSIPNIKAHRIVIAGADAAPNAHNHQAGMLVHGDATLVCVSEFQAQMFPAEWHKRVIRPFISEHALLTAARVRSGAIKKRENEFVYPCAAMKGLDATLEAWVRLTAVTTVKPKLTVTGSAYDKPSEYAQKIIDETESITFHQLKTPQELVDLLAERHVFVVNTFTEMFPMSFAIADHLQCDLHVLAEHGLTGIRETTNSLVPTTDRATFESCFKYALDPTNVKYAQMEPVVLDHETLTNQWMDVLQLDAAPKQKTVCLTMIVKNGRHTLEQCLASVKPVIDSWCIVDTGSTDGTQDFIREYLSAIPGDLYERPWKNFGFNRSQSIDLAKGRCDYDLWVDADDSIKVYDDFDKSTLIHDEYAIFIDDRGGHQTRSHIFRNNYGYRFEGALHEYLTTDKPHHCQPLEDLEYVRSDAGFAHKVTAIAQEQGLSPEAHQKLLHETQVHKYSLDAEILRAYLVEHPNDSRTVFYLAQSYKDAYNYKKAIKYYTKRAGMGGYDEEVFYSLLQVALLLCSETPNDVTSITNAFLKAYVHTPRRGAEVFFNLALYLRAKKQFALSFAYAKAGVNTPVPDGLFVYRDAYEWRIYDELAISAFYIERYAEAVQACEYLLGCDRLPEEHVDRVKTNLKFAQEELAR